MPAIATTTQRAWRKSSTPNSHDRKTPIKARVPITMPSGPVIASTMRAGCVQPAGRRELMKPNTNFFVALCGVMLPETASDLGVDPHNWQQNLDGSARYLLMMLVQFGDAQLALAAYNAGPDAVTRYGGIPPNRETQNHVSRVLMLAEPALAQSIDLSPVQTLLQGMQRRVAWRPQLGSFHHWSRGLLHLGQKVANLPTPTLGRHHHYHFWRSWIVMMTLPATRRLASPEPFPAQRQWVLSEPARTR